MVVNPFLSGWSVSDLTGIWDRRLRGEDRRDDRWPAAVGAGEDRWPEDDRRWLRVWRRGEDLATEMVKKQV